MSTLFVEDRVGSTPGCCPLFLACCISRAATWAGRTLCCIEIIHSRSDIYSELLSYWILEVIFAGTKDAESERGDMIIDQRLTQCSAKYLPKSYGDFHC